MNAPAQPNQSLIDGLACLQTLAAATEPVGCLAMARQLNLEPTRVNRLLRTLAHLGLAEQDHRRKYRPGPGIHVLAAQAMFGSGLLQRALSVLDSLRSHGLTVAMGVLWRLQVAYLYHAGPDTPVGEALGRTKLFPAERSAIGCVLLARLPKDDLRARLGGTLPAPIMTQLITTRRQGYALVPQPGGTRSLGVALPRTEAAIALAGTFPTASIPQLVESLQQAADRIQDASP